MKLSRILKHFLNCSLHLQFHLWPLSAWPASDHHHASSISKILYIHWIKAFHYSESLDQIASTLLFSTVVIPSNFILSSYPWPVWLLRVELLRCKSNSNSSSCICSAPPTISPMVHSIVNGRGVLSWTEMSLDDVWMLLSTTAWVSVLSATDSTHGVQRQSVNSRSPSRRSVRGTKRLPLLEARSDERVGMSATGVSRSEI